MALSRGWKIVLAVVAGVIALWILALVVFNVGSSEPGTGEGQPVIGLTTP